MKKLITALVTMFLSVVLTAQTTTSGLQGKITDKNGEAISEVSIDVKHTASGTIYSGITNAKGRYTIAGMRVGGPYEVIISHLSYNEIKQENIYVALGEFSTLNAQLEAYINELEGSVITATKGGTFTENRDGAAKNFNSKEINSVPTITRNVYDIARFTPFVNRNAGGLSITGSNNRFNSFLINGVPNNDIFGLSPSGMNGGQAGASPLSLDALEELQVVISPFDVRQSGFTGGGINAITKSGTNDWHFSAYEYFYNQDFIGKTPGKGVENRSKIPTQMKNIFGATLGGAIVKDKLFFFISAEQELQSMPRPYNYGDSNLGIATEDIDKALNKIKELTGGYDGGGVDAKNNEIRSTKVQASLDWNINKEDKLSLRYNFLLGKALNFENKANDFRFNDNGFWMNNQSHSVVAELSSQLRKDLFNNFRASYTNVFDNREIDGEPLPYIRINMGGNNAIELGTERFSAANNLKQHIFTISDDLSWYLGNHTLTFGTHNEFYDFTNLFIKDNYGSYEYNSLEDFLTVGTSAEEAPYRYDYSYSRDNITGTNRWAPNISAGQLGFYIQDEWNISEKFSLRYGFRLDMPLLFNEPRENTEFNNTDIAKRYYIATNQVPKFSMLLSPRIGFRWFVDDAKTALIRGGAGIFTGKIPFVWLSNSFLNTGLEFSRTQLDKNNMADALSNGFEFNIDPEQQYSESQNHTSEIDVVAKSFKMPQVFRVNLAWEQVLPLGIKTTLEALYSKNINSIHYQNLCLEQAGTLNNGADNRPTYSLANNSATNAPYTKDYTSIMYLSNSNKGYSVNASAKVEKDFYFGLNLMAYYTYSRSMSTFDAATSSQANSLWKYNLQSQGPNNPELSYSIFDRPHTVVASVGYSKDYARNFGTDVYLIYTGQSGPRHSYVYFGDVNGDGLRSNDLMYIPTDEEFKQMVFTDYKDRDGNIIMDAASQKADFDEYRNSNSYLKKHKGECAQRNGAIAGFEHHFDLRIVQKFYFYVKGQRHSIQVGLDMLNIGNLFNPAWGTFKDVGYGSYSPLSASVKDGSVTYQFNRAQKNPIYNISDFDSRWKAQISIRYAF